MQSQCKSGSAAPAVESCRTHGSENNNKVVPRLVVQHVSSVRGRIGKRLRKLRDQEAASAVLMSASPHVHCRSVVDFLQGKIGVPYGGFPEPFRSRVLKDKEVRSFNTQRPVIMGGKHL